MEGVGDTFITLFCEPTWSRDLQPRKEMYASTIPRAPILPLLFYIFLYFFTFFFILHFWYLFISYLFGRFDERKRREMWHEAVRISYTTYDEGTLYCTRSIMRVINSGGIITSVIIISLGMARIERKRCVASAPLSDTVKRIWVTFIRWAARRWHHGLDDS